MSDSSAIGNALIAKLGADTALLALMPNGVYEDQGPIGSTRVVVVSQITGNDEDVYGERAFEEVLFLVEARALMGSGGDVQAAAARIDALLAPRPPLPPPTLAVSGYQLMDIARVEPVRGTEVDERDESIRWKRRGGRYRIRCVLS